MICQQCKEPFVPTNKRGPTPKFCSQACKQANYRASRDKPVTRRSRSAPPKRVTLPRPQAETEKPVTENLRPLAKSSVDEFLSSLDASWRESATYHTERMNDNALHPHLRDGHRFLAGMYQELVTHSEAGRAASVTKERTNE